MGDISEKSAELGTGDCSADRPNAIAPAASPQRPRLFNFDAQGLRVIGSAETPWFVAADVCRALGLGGDRVSDAVSNLDDDEKGSDVVATLGGPQQMLTINESGLYALIFRSRKPQARLFRKWVTSEVLPTIRRTGGYNRPPETVPQLQAFSMRAREDFDDFAKLLSSLLGDKEWIALSWERIQTAIEEGDLFKLRREQLKKRFGELSVARWRSGLSRYLQGFWYMPVSAPGGTLILEPRYKLRWRIYIIKRSQGGAA